MRSFEKSLTIEFNEQFSYFQAGKRAVEKEWTYEKAMGLAEVYGSLQMLASCLLYLFGIEGPHNKMRDEKRTKNQWQKEGK